jgi:hypothetical protein
MHGGRCRRQSNLRKELTRRRMFARRHGLRIRVCTRESPAAWGAPARLASRRLQVRNPHVRQAARRCAARCEKPARSSCAVFGGRGSVQESAVAIPRAAMHEALRSEATRPCSRFANHVVNQSTPLPVFRARSAASPCTLERPRTVSVPICSADDESFSRDRDPRCSVISRPAR